MPLVATDRIDRHSASEWRLGENGRHFVDGISNCTFVDEFIAPWSQFLWIIANFADIYSLESNLQKFSISYGYGFAPSVHDDVIKWKHFLRYWPFVRGIHRSPVNSPHKGQWRGSLMFCLIRAWINSWVNSCEAGDLRHYLAHCDVIAMYTSLNKHPHHSPA